MDLRSVLAMAQQQQSIPGLLSMLRGGDPQSGGGRRFTPEQGQGQGGGPGGQGQLQMAQAAMGSEAAVNNALGEHDYGVVSSREDPLPAWQFDPGNWVQNGHIISKDKFYQDTHRPISDPASAGSLHPYRGSNNANAWSTTGELGYFGQLDPWATMWGAGGPGSG